MKPTQQQEKNLEKYLSGIMLYRETYFEVLDHMLCALERFGDSVNFQDVVNQVIREDFGGHDQLRKLDTNARKLIYTEGRHRYWKYFANNIKGVNAVLVVLLVGALYFLNVPVFINNDVVTFLLLPAMGVSGAMEAWRYFKQGVAFGSMKRSAKDSLFSMLSAMPVRVYLAVVLLRLVSKRADIVLPNQLNALLVALLLAAWLVYLRAIVKMYRDEFKPVAN